MKLSELCRSIALRPHGKETFFELAGHAKDLEGRLEEAEAKLAAAESKLAKVREWAETKAAEYFNDQVFENHALAVLTILDD